MAPAKTDLLTWRKQIGQLADQNSTTIKKACLGCRRQKVRCLRGEDPLIACSRCARLNLTCNVEPHRKGKRAKTDASNRVARNGDHFSEDHSRSVHLSASPLDRMGENHVSTPNRISPHQQNHFREGESLYPNHYHDEVPTYSNHHRKSITMQSSSMRSDISSQRSRNGENNEMPNYSTKSLFTVGEGNGNPLNVGRLTLASQLEQNNSPSISNENDRVADLKMRSDVIEEGLFTIAEAHYLVDFYFERMNGVIALLTPSINTFAHLRSKPSANFLLTCICAVACRFVWPQRSAAVYDFADAFVMHIYRGAQPGKVEHCQALSILSMWRSPIDPTGWRKLYAAITMAYELSMPTIARKLIDAKSKDAAEAAQLQRTMFQITCTEEHFCMQRRQKPMLNVEELPEPRDWIASLGKHCLDIDIRIAAAIDQLKIYRKLRDDLGNLRAEDTPGWSKGIQELRFLNQARSDQMYTGSFWLNAKEYGMPANFASSACGHYNSINHDFNYLQAIMAVYARKGMPKGGAFENDRCAAFLEASDRAITLIELIDKLMRSNEHYRFVHDGVMCSMAASAIWLVDNVRQMTTANVSRAAIALAKSVEITLPSATRWHEQSAYLHALLTYCRTKLVEQETAMADVASTNSSHVGLLDDLSWMIDLFPGQDNVHAWADAAFNTLPIV